MGNMQKLRRKLIQSMEGRINVFACKDCKHKIVTVDLCRGSTPGSMVCPKCQGVLTSSFYPSTLQKEKPKYGWFKPANDAVLREQIEWEIKWSGVPVTDDKKELCFKIMKDRIKNGGLCLKVLENKIGA